MQILTETKRRKNIFRSKMLFTTITTQYINQNILTLENLIL